MSESDVVRVLIETNPSPTPSTSESNLRIAGSGSSEPEVSRTRSQACDCKPGSTLPPWHSVLGHHDDASSVGTSTRLSEDDVQKAMSSAEMVYTFLPHAHLFQSPVKSDEQNKIFSLSLSYGRYIGRQSREEAGARENFMKIQQFARLRFGRIISTEFPIPKSIVHLECQFGHDWPIDARAVLKYLKWCPVCDAPESKLESVCRQLLERMYGAKFRRIRPQWLLNEDTQHPLEIDCYNEDLKLGLEANGEQHYVTGLYCDPEALSAIQDRDRKKARMCEKLGIHLIVVPYTVKLQDIQKFILTSLQKANRPPPPNTADIDITTLLPHERTLLKFSPKKPSGKRKNVSQTTTVELLQKRSRLASVVVDHDSDVDSDEAF